MSLDTKKSKQSLGPFLYFMKTDSEDVFPHEDNHVVILLDPAG